MLYAGLDRIDGRLLEAARDLGLSKWRTFWRMTVPLSRQTARDLGLSKWRTFWRMTVPLSRQTLLAGMFVAVLPMLGDYFTNQLLSSTPGTTMIGNVIEGTLETTSQTGQAAALSLVFLGILVPLMAFYVVSTARASRENL